MAATPEGKVKKKIRDILKEFNAYYCMPATGGYGSSGHPDFLGAIRAFFFGIEAKAGKGEPTELQMKRLWEISDAGGFAMIVNETNIDDLRMYLSRMYAGFFDHPSKPVLPTNLKAKHDR